MVVGDNNIAPYKKWASGKGVERQIMFTGPIRNIEQYYGASDIFVFPTHYDAFGNVCLEAMACGLPVITSHTCGASELIQDGKNGLIISANDPRELANKISSLEPVSRRLEIGENAADTAGHYTMQNHMTRIQSLYDRVIDEKSS